MNVDATPEKRPACTSNQHGGCWRAKSKPHKDEGRIEVVITFFHKFFVVLLGLRIVRLVKLRAVFGILHDYQCCPNRRWKTYEGRRVATLTALFVIYLCYSAVHRSEFRPTLCKTAVPFGGLFTKNQESVGA